MKYNGKEYYSQGDIYNAIEEENKTLKDKIEFLTQCLDDRDKSIAIMQEENKKLKADTAHTIKFNNKIIGELKLENKKLKEELRIYKKQYKHTMGEDYIDEDLYDLDC